MASFGRFTAGAGGVVETLSYTSPTLSLTQSAGTSPLTATIAGGGVSGSGTENFVSKWSDTDTLADSLYFSDNNFAKTIFEGSNNKGFYIDFNTSEYGYGLTETGFADTNLYYGLTIKPSTSGVTIGDGWGYDNFQTLNINSAERITKTTYNSEDNGLYLDFDNQLYSFGQGTRGLFVDVGKNNYYLGDYDDNNNFTYLNISDVNRIIKTSQGGQDKGLYLDFPNDNFKIGNNNNNLIVDGANLNIRTFLDGGTRGLYVDANNLLYALGSTETGDFVTESVVGFGANVSTGIYTMGDPPALVTGGDITLDANNSRFNINVSRTHLYNLDTETINALPTPLEGDIVYNNTLHNICFYDGSSWKTVFQIPM
jgi:hypothetical protein